MSIIRIRKELRDRLVDLGDGKSISRVVECLLEDAEVLDSSEEFHPVLVNVRLDDDVLGLLKRCKVYCNESHSDTIERLLDEFEGNVGD